jgi:tRNA 2-thiouridine synthesizing protein E
MPDINKFIGNEQAAEEDPEGHLLLLDPWSEDVARTLAAAEGLELTPRHLEVLRFLRVRYRERGPNDSAHEIMQALDAQFDRAGGKKALYQLFPGGPVGQGSRLAGLPAPPGARDPSFGSSM